MKTRGLILLTTICHLCILVGIGHGAAPLFVALPTLMQELIDNAFKLQLFGGYSVRLPLAAFISIIGYFVLVVAYLFNNNRRSYLIHSGLFILSFAFSIMVCDFSTGYFDGFVLLFGSPFLFALIRFILFLLPISKKQHRKESSV